MKKRKTRQDQEGKEKVRKRRKGVNQEREAVEENKVVVKRKSKKGTTNRVKKRVNKKDVSSNKRSKKVVDGVINTKGKKAVVRKKNKKTVDVSLGGSSNLVGNDGVVLGRGKKAVVRHIYETKGPSPIDYSSLPGPSYPVILPEKSKTTPFKLEKIGHPHISKTLAEHNGKISRAAEALHVSHWTLKKYIDKHRDLIEILNLTKEAELDFVENKLMDLIKTGNVAASIFYLKAQGKKRGWIEKLEEHDLSRRPNVTFKYTLVMPGENKTKAITMDVEEEKELKVLPGKFMGKAIVNGNEEEGE